MYTSKEVNAVTKLVLSSGRSSQTNTELTPPEPTMETLISNLKELMFISMKPLEAGMSPEPFLWTLSPELWTPSEQDHLDNCSDPIISFSAKLVQVTTGPRGTTLKELNSLIQSSMSSERKLKDAIVYRDSRSHIP